MTTVYQQTKARARKRWPALYGLLRRTLWRSLSRRALFERIHRQHGFGLGESRSGLGSNLARTAVLRQALPALCAELGVSVLLDLPCGDHFWMSSVDLGSIEYLGADIVEAQVEANRRRYGSERKRFLTLDAVAEPPPRAELILCRDLLVHLSLAEGLQVIQRFAHSSAHWVLLTTFPELASNSETDCARWRPLNLCLPPFALPPPERLIDERSGEELAPAYGKYLGLWTVRALQRHGTIGP